MASLSWAQRQQIVSDPRLISRRKQRRGRYIKSNLHKAYRPVGWRAWITALLEDRKKKARCKPIPAYLRPWTPCNRAVLVAGGEQAVALTLELQKYLKSEQQVQGKHMQGIWGKKTRKAAHQFKALSKAYPLLQAAMKAWQDG
jgi:hypothetical protein